MVDCNRGVLSFVDCHKCWLVFVDVFDYIFVLVKNKFVPTYKILFKIVIFVNKFS